MNTFIAGYPQNQGFYNSFQPNSIVREWLLSDMEVINLLSRADRAIGKFDIYSATVPNIGMFVSMHIAKEATQSSKIEGTQTQIEESLMDKDEVIDERRDDWDEVQNYIKAMTEAAEDLKTLPFSSRLIKRAHKTLLQGVRGKHKMPGAFRTSQNWIGGASISDAKFVPPVHTSVLELMGDIETFANSEAMQFPDLLKAAIIHYQFETIHPFLDGNGRVGRLLITLYLVDKGLLRYPILYLSDFFERNRALYYENLTSVREKNDLKQWFKFFLVGIIEISTKGTQALEDTIIMRDEILKAIANMGSRAQRAIKLLNHLYQHPRVDAAKVCEVVGISAASAYKLLDDFVAMGVLEEITGQQRSRIYIFEKYVALYR